MIITGKYPNLRLRRNRKFDWSRRLVEENTLSTNDLIMPIFLIEGKNKKESIKTMPDVYKYSIDRLPSIIDQALNNKILLKGGGHSMAGGCLLKDNKINEFN